MINLLTVGKFKLSDDVSLHAHHRLSDKAEKLNLDRRIQEA